MVQWPARQTDEAPERRSGEVRDSSDRKPRRGNGLEASPEAKAQVGSCGSEQGTDSISARRRKFYLRFERPVLNYVGVRKHPQTWLR